MRRRAFSERLGAVMVRYANSQLTAADVLPELFELATEAKGAVKRVIDQMERLTAGKPEGSRRSTPTPA